MSEGRPERTPWWASILTRITLVVAVLVIAAALLSGWLVYRGSRDQAVREAWIGMRHARDRAVERLNVFSTTLDDDISFLAGNAPLQEWTIALDSADTALTRAARERLSLLMESFLRSRPEYTQVRLIAADSLGMEVVRFDRRDGVVVQVPDSALQAKGDRDYYRSTNALAEGAHYFSAIDLNKEHGRLEVPYVPTLRVAAPVFTPRGRRAGIVVINSDVRPLFRDIAALNDHGPLILADDAGEVILHPDTALMFRFEFGGHATLQQALAGAAVGDTALASTTADRIALRYRFVPAVLGRPLEVAVLRDTRPLLDGIRRERDRNLLISAAVGACFALLVALFVRGLAAGLSRLTRSVEVHAAGERASPLPEHRRDEIGRLARSVARFQERIDQRVVEAENARAAAEASDRARRDFLANMSHEVRTPLNAILAMSEAITADALSAGDRERLALVQRSAARLKGLVDDLLLNARIGEGRLELKPVPTDLRQLFTDVAQGHVAAAEAKGLALRMDIAALPREATIDPLRAYQVIDNLVGNAVKYTRTGQVDVEARMDGEGAMHVTVKDTGPGLSKAELERVFERFERASSAESDGEGMGLGLAITRRLVDLMGGRILVESVPGAGSRFTLVLPVTGGRTTGPGPVVEPVVLQGLRVLYVEDVESNRMVMQQWAERWAWDLTLAVSAEDAIRTCETLAFDLILLDLDLGEGMRGSQLGMRLRGWRKLRYVPMLAVTAYVGEEQEAELLKAGLNDRITKPIDRTELLAAAHYWCGDPAEAAIRPDLSTIEEQYDHDAEKLLSVMQQYRREFTQWRIALRTSFHAGDQQATATVLHKFLPHAALLKVEHELQLPSALAAGLEGAWQEKVLDVLRACDRALLRRQRELQALTADRAVR